jgi:AcrR family transcriptional regulator
VRRAVFDAALAAVAADGYHDLSIEAIAATAGVNKTTIYRNWPSKAALLRAAAEDRSQALITNRTTGDAERDLIAFLSSVAQNVTSPIGQALVISTLNDSNNPSVKQERASFWEHRFQSAADLVRSAASDRTASTELDVDTVIEHLIAPVYLRAFVTGAPIDEEFIRKTVREAMHLATCGKTPASAAGGRQAGT